MSALNRKLRALAFSGKARSMAAADLEAFVRDRERAAAEKAWDEGREAEELAWEHAFNGHPVPEGEVCDECEVVNPYRKAVQS